MEPSSDLNDAIIYAEIGQRLIHDHKPYPTQLRDLTVVLEHIRQLLMNIENVQAPY